MSPILAFVESIVTFGKLKLNEVNLIFRGAMSRVYRPSLTALHLTIAKNCEEKL